MPGMEVRALMLTEGRRSLPINTALLLGSFRGSPHPLSASRATLEEVAL